MYVRTPPARTHAQGHRHAHTDARDPSTRGAGRARAISWRAARAAAARAARTPPAALRCTGSCSIVPPSPSAWPPAARLQCRILAHYRLADYVTRGTHLYNKRWQAEIG